VASLHNAGTDRTENTASKNPLLLLRAVASDGPSTADVFTGSCLAMDALLGPLFRFQPSCHNINRKEKDKYKERKERKLENGKHK
jgi:hypothetical protein